MKKKSGILLLVMGLVFGLIPQSALAEGEAVVSSISISVTVPKAGMTDSEATGLVSAEGTGLKDISIFWNDKTGYSTDDGNFTFAEGQYYYAVVTAYAEDGYVIQRGESIPGLDIDANDYKFGGNVDVTGGELYKAGVRTAELSGNNSDRLRVWVKVTAAAADETPAEPELIKIESVSLTATPPAAGTDTDDVDINSFLAVPSDGHYAVVGVSYYDTEPQFDDLGQLITPEFNGTLEAGRTYYAGMVMVPDEGYIFMQGGGEYPNTTFSVSGAESVSGNLLSVTNFYDEINGLTCLGFACVAFTPAVTVHTHTLMKTDKVEPTCTKEGAEAYWTCSECGKLFSDAEGTAEIAAPKAIAAIGHTWDEGKVTTEATCEKDGVKTYTCTACQETKTEAIAAKGHTWDEGKVTTEATCEKDGVKTYTCTACQETKTEVIPATGHDWGAWEITKEATEKEAGEEVRICKNDPEHKETRAIPVLTVEYRDTEGADSSWTKGSTDSLSFTYKRNRNDETTFSHFTGIKVDGVDVDASDYTAVSGSVVVTLTPEYLEKLAVGKHALTTMFDDGDDVTVSFTINEKVVPTETPAPTPAPAAKASPDTGDNNNAFIWLVILGAAVLTMLGTLKLRSRMTR